MNLTTEDTESTERATPETDGAERMAFGQEYMVPTEFARQLERERDEALRHLKEIKEYGTEEINAAVELRQKLAAALVERDEARAMLVRSNHFLQQAEENLDLIYKERDEAREELARIESLLLDPHAVFLNFLHGKIAKLDWQKLEHIHGPHPARKTPAWIPVFQALPDDGETVIIHTLGGEVWTGFIDAGVWRNVAGARIHEEEPVLHWRPFPDPPKI